MIIWLFYTFFLFSCVQENTRQTLSPSPVKVPDGSHHPVKAASPYSARVLSWITATLISNNIPIYTHLCMCTHTYLIAVNFNMCTQAVTMTLPSALFFSPEQNTFMSRAPESWFLGKLTHFQEHLCIPLFPSVAPVAHSWHFRLPVQLKWHRTTTEQNHSQSLNCPQCAYRMASRLLHSPPGNMGLLLLCGHLWASPAVLSIPCGVFLCSGCVFHKPSMLTPSLMRSSIVLHIDNAGISNHATVRRKDARCEAKI